ncbi:TPA: hypothetical protein ACPE3U_001201 [Citrobacter freundii]
MTALNKQALIAKIKKQTESFDTVVLKEDEANALLGELESKQTFQQAFFRQSLMYDVVAEAYEEAKEQIAKDVEIKARLCLESNSLFDRLRAAEKRIAEHNFENRLLANADRDIKALRQHIAELEARYKPKFVKCWSCKHDIEVLAIVDCDGYCPRCAAPIDLDDEPYAGIGAKGE